jgi:hypothetical protein
LSEDLTRLGLSTRGETINELQEMAEVRNIPIEMEDADIRRDGWEGQKECHRYCENTGCWIQVSVTLHN